MSRRGVNSSEENAMNSEETRVKRDKPVIMCRAFTLIELLAVILVLSILFGFITSAIRRSIVKARQTQATMDRNTLKAALQAYRAEYGTWPIDDSYVSGTPISNNVVVIDRLREGNPTYNSKNIRFLSINDYNFENDVQKSGSIVSPVNKKTKYVFIFDLNNDAASVN